MPTVREDVAFGPLNMGLDRAHGRPPCRRGARRRADDRRRRPGAAPALDGGAPARRDRDRLSMRPQLLVLDEPSANLDPRARRELLDVLERIDRTMLVVTHDLPFAAELCERAVILSAGRVVPPTTACDECSARRRGCSRRTTSSCPPGSTPGWSSAAAWPRTCWRGAGAPSSARREHSEPELSRRAGLRSPITSGSPSRCSTPAPSASTPAAPVTSASRSAMSRRGRGFGSGRACSSTSRRCRRRRRRWHARLDAARRRAGGDPAVGAPGRRAGNGAGGCGGGDRSCASRRSPPRPRRNRRLLRRTRRAGFSSTSSATAAHPSARRSRPSSTAYGAIVLTVDAPRLGRRERDLRTGFRVPAEIDVRARRCASGGWEGATPVQTLGAIDPRSPGRPRRAALVPRRCRSS